MKVLYEIDETTKLSEEQIRMLEELDGKPVYFDEDNPELSAEQLARFKSISKERQSERAKQTVTIRLSPWALRRARSLGKGYTSVLSRILEEALRDEEMIRQNL